MDDDDDDRVHGRTEVERRKNYMDNLEELFGRTHGDLFQIVKECLSNSPKKRPDSNILLARLEAVKREVDDEQGGPAVRQLDVEKTLMQLQLQTMGKEIEALKVRNSIPSEY